MIKRFFAKKDNTITNAYQEGLSTRGTGSNMGASDILEVFSIYGQASETSSELARTLIQFDENELASARSQGSLPSAGNVSWFLKLYDAQHSETTPSNYDLEVAALSTDWEEGYGMDMENYEDLTRNAVGSNWINRAGSTQWSSEGGDYRSESKSSKTFDSGLENLDIDVTDIVEKWLDNTWNNYGFMVKLTDAYESLATSFYTKKFFGRESSFFFQRPVLEARWNDSRRDDRGLFFASSSLATSEDNLNNLYLYNVSRGRLVDYPHAPTSASIRTDAGNAATEVGLFEVSRVSTGVYKISGAVETNSTTVYDVWYSGSVAYYTGSINVKSFSSQNSSVASDYILSMPKLKNEYRKGQTYRMDLYVRPKNWSPNIYTVASQTSISSTIIPSASYEIRRSIDDHIVIPYGTGSTNDSDHFSMMSYDESGNYFHIDTSFFEPGYLYKVNYSFYDYVEGWQEQPFSFKFRVVD